MLVEELVPDWTEYSQLVIDIGNTGRMPLPLRVEVGPESGAEAQRDRVMHRFELAPRSRVVERVSLADLKLAARGRFSLDSVNVLYLFFDSEVAQEGPGEEYCVGAIWLE